MAEGTLSVGVELDSRNAFEGFADAVMKEVRPALDAVRREMDAKLSGGGGKKAGSGLGSGIASSLAKELGAAGDKGSKALTAALASGFPKAQGRVEEAARQYANALTRVMAPGGRQAADRWSAEFQRAVAARDALAPFHQQLRAGGGGGGSGIMGSLGGIVGGAFLGGFAGSLAVGALGVITSIASKVQSAITGMLSGGWDRLVSIDTAKTKMLALKVSASDVELVMKSALTAVKGTAFGLQDAATVAATALAAGVKPGKALTDYLRLTADTAALTRRSGEDMGAAFEAMGHILNQVTTNGYATNDELQQLADAGLPIYQNLGKNLKLTAAEVISLASETGIGASVVRQALQDTVGGAALKMGESFEGAVENSKAALSRLGEALLKPLFQPAKDGVSDFTRGIDDLTKSVVQNGPEITRVFQAIAIACVDMTVFALRAIGDLAQGIGEVMMPIGDMMGLWFDWQAWQEENDKGPDDPTVKRLREQAQAAYGMGEGIAGLGEKLKGLEADAVKDRINALSDSIVRGQEVTLEYAKSQEVLANAFKAGNGAIVYEQQKNDWMNKVREANARGENGWAIPAPIRPGEIPGTAGGGMPADVTKPSGSGGADKTPWLPAGAAIPTYEELLAAGGAAGTTAVTDAVSGLPPAAADLTGAAADLTAAASSLATSGGYRVSIPIGPGGDVKGAHSQIAAANTIASGLGLEFISGLRPVGSTTPGSYHDSGQAGDFSNGAGNTNEMLSFAQVMSQNFAPYIAELIYSDPRFSGNLLNGQPHQYDAGTLADHVNHVHLAIKDGMAAAFAAAVSTGGVAIPGMPSMTSLPSMPTSSDSSSTSSLSPGQSYGTPITVPGLGTVLPIIETDYSKLGLAPGTYQIPGGITAPDPAKIAAQQAAIDGLNRDLVLKEQRIREMKASAAQSEKLSAANEFQELKDKIKAEQEKLEKLKRGESEQSQTITVGQPQAADYSKLPFGNPQRILAGAIGGMGGTPEDIAALVGPIMQSATAPISQVAGDVTASVLGIPLPGPMGYPGVPTAPTTDLNTLVKEQNPLALAQAAGIPVPDYTRQGGDASAQDLATNTGPPTDSMGRMYSDTAALVDRTFTNLDAAEKARHDQTMTVLNEVRERLAGDYVGPVMTDAVSTGIGAMGDAAAGAIGQSMGQTAGPIIASAVAGATQGVSGQGTGGAMVNSSVLSAVAAGNGLGAFLGLGMAGGGGVYGGTPGKDSVPALLMPNEYVFNTTDVAKMGGIEGVERFRKALYNGGVRKFATGGGVDVTASVGADFFGVSQVPLISTIVNLLVGVLLKVIGVTIESRDTLDEMSKDFRDWRGDFKAFDATGRLMNDTSGLVDRSGSSEQAAADERIRILKDVLEGLFKFIVEKIIVPIAKAVGNSLLQAASSAVSGAMASAFPGGSIVGGMVGNVIQSAGGTAIEIGAEVGTIVAESVFSVAQEAIFSLLQSIFPGVTTGLFGGGILAALFDPITSLLNNLMGGISMVFGGLVGGLSTLIPGLPFDQGGVAVGTGLMPKATIRPERVLSPQQTQSFDRLVEVLAAGRGAAQTTIHAPFTVTGGERGGRDARDKLLALMS